MPASSTDDGTGKALPEAVVEDLLASDRRERMLAVLAGRPSPIPLDDLMRAVLADERDAVPDEVPREDCAAARIEAYEEHLPKLTATDVVRYDSLVGTVELSDEWIVGRLERPANPTEQ